jgi:hypothetical protein
LCYEFKDIIDDKLSAQPAKVDQPMEVDVEEGAWFNNPSNRRPSRAQSAAKHHEIRRQIQNWSPIDSSNLVKQKLGLKYY